MWQCLALLWPEKCTTPNKRHTWNISYIKWSRFRHTEETYLLLHINISSKLFLICVIILLLPNCHFSACCYICSVPLKLLWTIKLTSCFGGNSLAVGAKLLLLSLWHSDRSKMIASLCRIDKAPCMKVVFSVFQCTLSPGLISFNFLVL